MGESHRLSSALYTSVSFVVPAFLSGGICSVRVTFSLKFSYSGHSATPFLFTGCRVFPCVPASGSPRRSLRAEPASCAVQPPRHNVSELSQFHQPAGESQLVSNAPHPVRLILFVSFQLTVFTPTARSDVATHKFSPISLHTAHCTLHTE